MPFGLCNVSTTSFMCCMTLIFIDMVEEGMDVFMYDFFVYRDSFVKYPINLEWVLE